MKAVHLGQVGCMYIASEGQRARGAGGEDTSRNGEHDHEPTYQIAPDYGSEKWP